MVFRSRVARAMSAVGMAMCAAALILTTIGQGAHILWQVGPWLAMIAGAIWALYWRPHVTSDEHGIRMVNVVHTVEVPWAAIRRIETRWALTLVTDRGKHTAWALSSPGAAPEILEDEWRAKRDDRAASEPNEPVTTWQWEIVLGAIALAALCAASIATG